MYIYLLMRTHSSSTPLHRSCCCRPGRDGYTQPRRSCSLEQCCHTNTRPYVVHQQTCSSSHDRGRCSSQESCRLSCPQSRGERGFLSRPHTGRSRQLGLGNKEMFVKFILETRRTGGSFFSYERVQPAGLISISCNWVIFA